MKGVNKWIGVGIVGKNPESRILDNGTKVTRFSLATSEVYKNRQREKIEETTWHNIVIWGRLADISEKYVKKGDLISIEGKIRNRKWTDKEGNERYHNEIVVDNMTMLSTKGQSGSAEQDSAPYDAGTDEEEVDGLPF